MNLILLVFAFVVAFIAAVFNSLEPHRTRLIACALSFFFLACIFGNSAITSFFSR